MCVAAIAGTALHSVSYPTPHTDPTKALTETSREQTITRIVYWLVAWLQIISLGCTKLSAMFFYRRIFAPAHNVVFNIASWVLIVIMVCWALSFFWATVFLCDTNFSYLWTNLENQTKCTNTVAEMEGLAISDVITDALILLFPLPSIWRLQMKTKQKVAVTVIFMVGALAIAASATRLSIQLQTLSVEFDSKSDEDFISTAALYFLILEAGFGLCAVCLPSLAGSLKLKAVQNLIDAFTSIFSTRSSRSRESFRSNHATRAHRLNSLTDSDHAQIIGGATNKSANSFEMQPVPNISNAGIQLTREFDLRAEVV